MRVGTTHDLGALVRQERQDQGLTQAELAERIGTTRQWVSQLESGTLNPRVGLVLAALAALDLDLDVRLSKAPVTGQRPLEAAHSGATLSSSVLERVSRSSVNGLTEAHLRSREPNSALIGQDWARSIVPSEAVQRIVDQQVERLRALEARSTEPSKTVDPEQ